jgi:signal transduction histidine kinase
MIMDLSNIDLSWAPAVLAFLSVIGVVAAMIRWLVKHYFDEIKAEFKPNGGSSLKDQVNRLESEHKKLFNKFEKAEEQAMKDHKDLADKIDKVYSTIINILKDKN